MNNSYNQMISSQEVKPKKPKKTINVSIQSKKYSVAINKILDKWEENGLNASNEVSENILLVDKLNKSITFCNMLNIYELIEKMVGLYENLDSPTAFMKIESILSEVVTIDNSKLSNVLSQLNQEYMVNKKENNNIRNKNDEPKFVEEPKFIENNTNQNSISQCNINNDNVNQNNFNNNSVNHNNINDIPQRKSPQSNKQDNLDGYNNSNNISNNNQPIQDTGEEVSIPSDFLFND